jgi:hypothetical protein
MGRWGDREKKAVGWTKRSVSTMTKKERWGEIKRR